MCHGPLPISANSPLTDCEVAEALPVFPWTLLLGLALRSADPKSRGDANTAGTAVTSISGRNFAQAPCWSDSGREEAICTRWHTWPVWDWESEFRC